MTSPLNRAFGAFQMAEIAIRAAATELARRCVVREVEVGYAADENGEYHQHWVYVDGAPFSLTFADVRHEELLPLYRAAFGDFATPDLAVVIDRFKAACDRLDIVQLSVAGAKLTISPAPAESPALAA